MVQPNDLRTVAVAAHLIRFVRQQTRGSETSDDSALILAVSTRGTSEQSMSRAVSLVAAVAVPRIY